MKSQGNKEFYRAVEEWDTGEGAEKRNRPGFRG